MWGHVKCLEAYINLDYLVNAWNDEEDTRTNCRSSLDAAQSVDDASLILRDDFDNTYQRERKREDYQDDRNER